MKILLSVVLPFLSLVFIPVYGGTTENDLWLPLADYIQMEYCISSSGQALYVGLHSGGQQERLDVLDVRNKEIIHHIALPEPGIHFSIFDCHSVALVSRTRLYVFSLLEGQANIHGHDVLTGVFLQGERSLNRVVLGVHDTAYVFSGVEEEGLGKVRCVNTNSWDVKMCYNCPCGESICTQVKHREVYAHPSSQWIYTSIKNDELIRYKLDPGSCSLFDSSRLLISEFHNLWFSNDGSFLITDNGHVYSHDNWGDPSTDETHHDGTLMKKPVASVASSNGYTGNRYRAMLVNSAMLKYAVGIAGTFWLNEEISVFSLPYYDYLGPLYYPSVQNDNGLPLARRLDYDPLNDVVYVVADFNVMANAVLGIAVLHMPSGPWPEPPIPHGGSLLSSVNENGDDVWLITSGADTSMADNSLPEPYKKKEWMYSVLHQKPYFVYMIGKRLAILDPNTQLVHRSYILPLPGLKMADSQDGYIIVAHDSYISIVPLQPSSFIPMKTFFTGMGGVTSLVVGPGTVVHIFPAHTHWTDVLCLDYFSGDLDRCGCTNYAGVGAILHPGEAWVLSMSSGLWPQIAFKYATQKHSCLLRVEDEREGYYGSKAWFFLDGSRFATDAGNVVASSDLKVKGTLLPIAHAPFRNPYKWMDHSQNYPNQTFVMDERNTYLSVYGWPWLNKMGAIEIPFHDKCIAAQPAFPPGADQSNRPYKPLQVHVSPDGSTVFTLVEHIIKDVTYFSIGFIHNIRVEKEEDLKTRLTSNGDECDLVTPTFPVNPPVQPAAPPPKDPNAIPHNSNTLVKTGASTATHTLNGVIIGAAVGTAILVVVAGTAIGFAIYCTRARAKRQEDEMRTAPPQTPPPQEDLSHLQGAMGPPPSYSGPVYFMPGPMDQVPTILFTPPTDENKVDLSK